MMILSFNDLDFVVHADEFSQNHARFLEQEVKYSREYFWLERDKEKLLNDLWDKAAHFNFNRDEVDFNGLHNQFALSVNTAKHEDKLIWDDINNLIHQIELLETGAPPRWG